MNRVIEKINNAKSIAVFPHINEDGDALGTCFAFAEVMRRLGKEAVVYVNDIPEKRLEFMGSDYVVYDEDKTYSYDLCACLDCGDLQRIGRRIKLFNEINNSINIDHHATNTNFADANYVCGGASAAAEVLYCVFEEMGITLEKREAEHLYTAICSDTGSFKYSSTSPKTMRIAAKLMEYGFNFSEISRRLFDCRSYDAAMMCAEVTMGMKSYENGKITIVTVDDSIYEKYGIDVKDAPNFVDIPRCIEGAEAAACIKHQNGTIRVNLRSNGNADVSKTALSFGGGGHLRAAGCNIDASSLEEAEKIIADALRKVI